MDLNDIMHFVAALRKKKKISQQQMSNDLHISRATISNFENGTSTDIGVKKVLYILDYLGCCVDIKEKSRFPVFEEIVNE